ncbi:hypothetical protein [Streptomyces triticiradicis]|uniref:hypothetical protein n=1 Tax=Streptomyces triticiradicis TaxID=2651189 RepID=UPI001CEDFFC1|nr:hypothetical protein [Streptomyces triticiradicis]
MRRVRELLTVVGALVVVLAVALSAAPSALAGGPTSVLVVSPESSEGAALYYSDARYCELMRLLGEASSGSRKDPHGLGVADGHQLNVTWLVHDVSAWRVDRVYPDAPRSRDVWINTTTDMTTMNSYWHKARHPAQVRALFKKLGVLGKAKQRGDGGIRPGPWQTPEVTSAAPAPARTPAPAAGPATRTAAATGDGTDWWWAIPGAAAGAVLARIRRPHKGEPRQELRDV